VSGHPADGAAPHAVEGRPAPSPDPETTAPAEESESPPRPATGPGFARGQGEASGTSAGLLSDAGRLIAAWSRERALSASAATGICLALALCAAGWFTAGTPSGTIKAVTALWASYLAALAARGIAGVAPDGHAGVPAARARARARWVAALGWLLAEAVCYAGLAEGAAAHHWSAAWTMAIAALSLIAVRDLMAACAGPSGMTLSQGGTAWRCIDLLLSLPPGVRVLVVGVVALAGGEHAALIGLLDWSVIAVGYRLVAQSGPASDRAARAEQDQERPAGPVPWSGTMVLLLSPAGEELVRPQRAAAPPAPPPPVPPGDQARRQTPRPESAPQAAVVRRLRDDGELARWLGKPVRGNLLPLPPAVLGLAATATLAFLGLRGLPTYLFLAPALIMVLLAAPGSSNPHTGRLDWLVPPVLLGWQLLYLAAVGASVGIPGPVTFATGTALLIWYADLAFPGRPVMLVRLPVTTKSGAPAAPARERGAALGWEGRTLALGLAAAAGIGTYAYLAMTVYLAALIAVKVLATRPGVDAVAEPRADAGNVRG
jgi:hypothetical protein